MSCEEDLLRGIAREVENEIRSRLHGFLGGMIRHYLPQTWEFHTEQGTAFLSVDIGGIVTVGAGPAARPDVTIEAGHDRLRAVLTSRRREAAPAGPLTVTPHSAKGRAAFDYLRGRLGL
jgi:hypothetical protein